VHAAHGRCKSRAFRIIAARIAEGQNLLAEPVDPLFGGLTVWQWFELFVGTHAPNGMGAFVRIEWPDGGAYADQAALTVHALGFVSEALTSKKPEMIKVE
jgi:hypothetical protein